MSSYKDSSWHFSTDFSTDFSKISFRNSSRKSWDTEVQKCDVYMDFSKDSCTIFCKNFVVPLGIFPRISPGISLGIYPRIPLGLPIDMRDIILPFFYGTHPAISPVSFLRIRPEFTLRCFYHWLLQIFSTDFFQLLLFVIILKVLFRFLWECLLKLLLECCWDFSRNSWWKSS